MNSQIIILLLLFLVLTNGCKNEAIQSLNLMEYGIENTSDATPVVIEAIKKCKKKGNQETGISKRNLSFLPNLCAG